jgi:hypothetical protein
MSFKSFFASAEDWFEKIFGHTTWQQTASTTIALSAPLVESLVAVTAGEADSAKVQEVVNEVQTDLATVAQLIKQSQGGTNTFQTIANILNSVKNNLSGLLAAGHIKDQATLEKVTGIVNTVLGELVAILGSIPTN